MARLWSEGKSEIEIAEYFGWDVNRVSVEVAFARRRGVRLPYRHRHSAPAFPAQVAA